jgi:phosphoribosylpyrophosphate synthetase
VLCAEVWQETAEKLESEHPNRFHYIPIDWGKFPDGTDNITISGFSPTNLIAGEHVLFLASFFNNDVTLSQFSVLIVLLQSFIQSMTIVLPYYPVGTNERVEVEGKVATANTYSILLSNLPSIGSPSRIMIYDIHALQNRFYFHNSTIPSLHSTIPLVLNRLTDLSCKIAFPDDGAAKRFGQLFKDRGFDIIVCGKVRIGDQRKITLASDPREIVGNECPFICYVLVLVNNQYSSGQCVVIVDDLVQTGGTLYECGKALLEGGATKVFAFVAHAVFPHDCWKDFLRSTEPKGKRAIFEKFWLTNSQPSVTRNIPGNDCFEIVDILPQIIQDLDAY